MRLGFMTGCMARADLRDIAQWAQGSGFRSLEVASWPADQEGEFVAAHIDVERVSRTTAGDVTGMLGEHGLDACALAYYENNLHPDSTQRAKVNDHLRRCVDAAFELGIPAVGTFIGRDPTRTIEENLDVAREVFGPIVADADRAGVKLMFENAVVEHWDPDLNVGNIGCLPEFWPDLFEVGLHLNYDPSHLVYLGFDALAILENAIDRIALVQAKDIQILENGRQSWGWPGRRQPRTEPFDSGWWRFRVPGLGVIDWIAMVDRLAELGYGGAVSVEHEDPVWGGTPELTRKGLVFAHRTLSPLIE